MGNGGTSSNTGGAAHSSNTTRSTVGRNSSRNNKGTTTMPTTRLSREQLRAKSFVERELVGQQNDDDDNADDNDGEEGGGRDESSSSSSPLLDDNNRSTTTNVMMIETLEADVERLAAKCAALESQNILVSVQQLDLVARYFSLFLSLAVLYAYWNIMTTVVLPRFFQDLLPMLLDALRRRRGGGEGEDHLLGKNHYEEALLGDGLDLLLSHRIWVTRVLQVILLVIPYVYNRWTHGSMHRRFQVFVIAFIIIIRIRMCRWRERIFLQEEEPATSAGGDGGTHTIRISTIPRYGEACTNDGIWEANYEISARFLYLSILRLRGLWTKTAQYLSSRADFVPVGYIRELSKLQDQAPATPWEEVERILPAHLVRRLAEIEREPIASASIGQVHVARLVGSDEKVVVKVQHPHARTLMMDDFRSLKILTRIIGWLEPDYAFMEILMNEWAVEAIKELDFRFEAEHLREASQSIRTLIPTKDTVVYSNVTAGGKGVEKPVPFQVQIPEPKEELSNRDVLLMNFCEGCRIDDFAQIERWGLSRAAVMDGVSQAFAHLMYCSTIFNGDPHAGNLLVRPGIEMDDSKGFTIVLLDWGLAKRLPEQKRIAFCQMVFAAATVDYGLLLDSYKTVGLKMKREDAGQSMEDMRFFLRDMAPRDVARKRIKSKMKQGEEMRKTTNEKVPMESKAYPGEFFFFIRVNELLHGLGSRFSVNLGYLDALRPYAEKGLRMSAHYDLPTEVPSLMAVDNRNGGADSLLETKLAAVLEELTKEGKFVGGQVCVLDKDGKTQADIVAGSLGGLRSHIPMSHDALILGYSTTKAVTATLAHIMVRDGYLSYDEPICERVWKQFCPFEDPPPKLHRALKLPHDEVERRWKWKREITLRHILSHSAGLWSAFPAKLTIQKMAFCEDCFAGFEYDPDAPEDTLLPTNRPSDGTQAYHFMSFGWLVAGTLCGAYAERHERTSSTFEEVYAALLEPKLSDKTKESGFRPLGGSGSHILAQTVTSDIRASQMIQRKREMDMESDSADADANETKKMMAMFKGKEFLLDPRIWNSQDALTANVPAAGGRFSAAGLASFYHDLASDNLLGKDFLDQVASSDVAKTTSTSIAGVQGVTRLTNDANADDMTHTKMSMGYQLIRTDRDSEDFYSGFGHAGVGGSIGFVHRPTGISMAVMVNKADQGQDITLRILRVIGDHFEI